MPAYAKHGTLTANTVTSITLTGIRNSASTNGGETAIIVRNRDTAADLFVTFNANTPAVEGDDTLLIPAGQTLRWPATGDTATVALICAAAAKYSVQALRYTA